MTDRADVSLVGMNITDVPPKKLDRSFVEENAL
jgi:hypothetical protein